MPTRKIGEVHVHEGKPGQFSMRALYTAMKVSRSGHYAWCARDKSTCPVEHAIARQFYQDKARAGAPSIAHALREEV